MIDAADSTQPTGGAYERDPGLAAERTELAWGRSALSLLACGAAVAKGVPQVHGGQGRTWLGVAMLALGGLVWLSGVPLAAARKRSHGQRTPAQFHELAPLAWGTALVGAAGLVVAALFPS